MMHSGRGIDIQGKIYRFANSETAKTKLLTSFTDPKKPEVIKNERLLEAAQYILTFAEFRTAEMDFFFAKLVSAKLNNPMFWTDLKSKKHSEMSQAIDHYLMNDNALLQLLKKALWDYSEFKNPSDEDIRVFFRYLLNIETAIYRSEMTKPEMNSTVKIAAQLKPSPPPEIKTDIPTPLTTDLFLENSTPAAPLTTSLPTDEKKPVEETPLKQESKESLSECFPGVPLYPDHVPKPDTVSNESK